jgi:hypothetical protein
MRTFESGATRSNDDEKIDYEGFMSPAAVRLFGRYMQRHQICEDGSQRASDNWQNGIPLSSYMKSMFRHFVDLWELHRRGDTLTGPGIEEALGALMFNVQGYAHEWVKEEERVASERYSQVMEDIPEGMLVPGATHLYGDGQRDHGDEQREQSQTKGKKMKRGNQ